MWVEAAYTYGWIPKLHHLVPNALSAPPPPLSQSASLPTATDERERAWVSTGLRQLAAALDQLASEHSARLLWNPSLLWQRDITSAVDKAFWPVW